MSQVPYGIHRMDMGTLSSTPLHTDGFYYDFSASAFSDSSFLGIRVINGLGGFGGVQMICIDPESGQRLWEETLDDTTIGPIDFSIVPAVMAWNPVSGEYLTVNYNANLTGMNINTVDTIGHRYVTRAAWQPFMQPLTLAFTPDGVCHTILEDGALYTLDTTTGDVAKIGDTGLSPALSPQAMAWDGITGSFIWSTMTNRGCLLCSIDPETGEASEINRFAGNEQLTSLGLPMSTTVYGAPQKPSELRITPAAPGSLEVTVAFTLPDKTYGGASLDGPLSYTLWIDGRNIANEIPCEPGRYVSLNTQLPNGMHRFALLVKGKGGPAPLLCLEKHVGYDTPCAPANLTAAIDGNSIAVSWDAVTQGINGGFVDAPGVTYDLYLLPGNQKLATGVTTTNHTLPIPAELRTYRIAVAAVNSDGTEGERALSAPLLAGDAYTIPFNADFSDPSFIDVWQIHDRDGDGATWQYADWNGEMQCSPGASVGDNWLVTPPVTMSGSDLHEVVIDMRTTFANSYGKLRIMAGKRGAPLDEYQSVATLDNLELLDFGHVTADLRVPADGSYNIGIVECSDQGNRSMVRLRSVGIRRVAPLSAPSPVTSLSVTPFPDESLAATVKFTLPTTDLAGNVLDGISRVSILLDGVEVASPQVAAPGTTQSVTIPDIPEPGKHTFSVICSNASGDGKPAGTEAFIGVFSAPWEESFASPDGMEYWSDEYDFTTNPGFPVFSYLDYERAVQVQHTAIVAPVNLWLFSPEFKLDAESVYSWEFDYKHMYYGEEPFFLTIGDTRESSSHENLMQLPTDNKYMWGHVEAQIITSESGKYTLGFHASAGKDWEYVSYALKNLSLKYVSSAKAPDVVTGIVFSPDHTGALSCDISLTAPTTDIKGRQLTALDRIEIYRDGALTPVKVFTAPRPGELLSMTDAHPVYGNNRYTFVAYGSEGKGKEISLTAFVGEDIPTVTGFKLGSTPDNMRARMTWQDSPTGAHGGIVIPDKLRYTLFEYDPESGAIDIVAENFKGNEYLFEQTDLADVTQEYHHYGIIPVNDAGSGELTTASVMLGRLYTLPYSESFPQGYAQTGPWSILSGDYYCCWSPVNGFFDGYDAQDEDGGCVGMYNGYYTYQGDRLTTPKISLAGIPDPTLTFHVVLSRQTPSTTYPLPALMRVCVSADDEDFDYLTDDEQFCFDGSDTGWKQYTIDLSRYVGSDNIRVGFDGYTNGHAEILLLDNIQVAGTSAITGIPSALSSPDIIPIPGGVEIHGCSGCHILITDAAGRTYLSAISAHDTMTHLLPSGIYIVKVDDHVSKIAIR